MKEQFIHVENKAKCRLEHTNTYLYTKTHACIRIIEIHIYGHTSISKQAFI